MTVRLEVRWTPHRSSARRAGTWGAIILLLVAGQASCTSPAGPAGPTRTTSGHPPRVGRNANTPWFTASVSPSGRTVRVWVGSVDPGADPSCATYTHQVAETATAVTIAFTVHRRTGGDGRNFACMSSGRMRPRRIVLRAPLANRPVYDGVQARPRTIHREADLVRVTWLPRGWRLPRAIPEGESGALAWSRYFGSDGAGWSATLVQGQRGSAWRIKPGETPGTRGHAGSMVIYVHGPLETINWIQGDQALRLVGQLDHAGSFDHQGDLRKIAEGVRLPPRR